MNRQFKFNSLAALVLALAFYWYFMFTKHNAPLAAIIPFADDPYDACGSFCMILSILLAALALFRGFRPFRAGQPMAVQVVFLARTQIAIASGVLVTLAADAIAMARHPNMWTGKTATTGLLTLMIGLAALSLAVVFLVCKPTRRIELPAIQNASKRAIFIALTCAVVLALFPEQIIHSVLLHFLAIVLGFVLIAAPQAAIAKALLPYDTTGVRTASPSPARSGLWIQWVSVALIGFAIGAFALLEEIFVDGAGKAPPLQVIVVSSMFIGAGVSALLVAFAFFKTPLGLFRKASYR